MNRFIFRGLLLGLISLGGAQSLQAQAGGAGSPLGGQSAQATYQSPVQAGDVVEVVRVARPKLEEINCCNYSLGFLVSRYQQGQLQIVGLGTWDGKDWYRVTYDGGDITVTIENF